MRFFQMFLEESSIKFVGYHENAKMKLKTYQWIVMDELLHSH